MAELAAKLDVTVDAANLYLYDSFSFIKFAIPTKAPTMTHDVTLTIQISPKLLEVCQTIAAALKANSVVAPPPSVPQPVAVAQSPKESKAPATTPSTPAAPSPLATVEPAASVTIADTAATTSTAPAAALTIEQVKTLAATKAKKVGAAVVKAIIADTGAATIGEIKDALVLASLAANLEAL